MTPALSPFAEQPVPWAVLIAFVCAAVALAVVAVYDRLHK